MSSPRPPADAPPPGRYRHYKGGVYAVLDLARHSETEDWLVIYRDEAGGGLWARPLGMWNDTVAGAPHFAPLTASTSRP
jgi:hypothetical protein